MNIGIIGRNYGAKVHQPAFVADSRCVVVSICGKDGGQGLINDPTIDIISLAVPYNVQPTLAGAALEAGKHVFCDKLLALNGTSALPIIAAMQKGSKKLALNLPIPEQKAWTEAKEIIGGGYMGEIRKITVVWEIETNMIRDGVKNWKTKIGAGGALNMRMPHVLHYLEWLGFKLQYLRARMCHIKDNEADNGVDVWATTENGVPITISLFNGAFAGTGHAVSIYGENGSLFLRNTLADRVCNFELLVSKRGLGLVKIPYDLVSKENDLILPTAKSITRFIDMIDMSKVGEDFVPGIKEGIRIQKLIDAVRISAEMDEPVLV